MNIQSHLSELTRAVRDLIRIGIIVDVDTGRVRCRVQLGGNTSDWLQWLTYRAGGARTWWAPSIGEQVVVLALGGELDTAFVLPAINSDDFPAPSVSPEAYHTRFSDGAVIEYEPETGALSVTGIKTANISAQVAVEVSAPQVTIIASQKITLDTPEVVCTNKLTVGTLELKKGGKMSGDIDHGAGTFKSNGVQVDKHGHSGVQRGGDWTEETR
ncbi:phage baseplate assembly protein V [Serratia marcescens]|uniref:phage baseplate assembly protein V n=1 Tax=Serratia marcescens TaxID=615 RepID=UPI000E3E7169|nr:phage baseplate assembly protein V [Serratia marcescens]RFS88207.1 baseplate assembly protein [Serratia marcescens]